MNTSPHAEELALISRHAVEHGLHLTGKQLEQLVGYADMLEEQNRAMNLVSRKETAPLLIRHIFHSLLIGFAYPFLPGQKVLDLGTGGGLPGIPLAIAYPETSFLLVDATGKKITACRKMADDLGLKNVLTRKVRAEEIRGLTFDLVLSRQVAQLATLCRYCEPLIGEDGLLICLKGGTLEGEIEAALSAAKRNNGFPADIRMESIEEYSPCFAEKYIVIAAGKES